MIARLNIGGPTTHVISLNAGLDPSQYTSLLVSGRENVGEGTMLDLALERGIEPIIIPEIMGHANLKFRDVIALRKLYHLICRERPHVVHTHTAKAGFLGRLAAWLAGVPVVVHTYHGHVLHGYFGCAKSWFLHRMEQALGYLSDCLIAVSDEVKHELVAYGVAPPGKIVVIPLGFELEPFLNCETHQGEFRHELGIRPGSPLVGIVGRIFPIKNHRLFLTAAGKVAAEAATARFVIVGDGVLRSEMEQYVRDLGIADRVFFIGWRFDMPRIYADLNVLVVSSNSEGTPVSIIEAMAAGCPVVATGVGGVPDLIIDGKTGHLVPPGDADRLARAILRVLQEPQSASLMAQTSRTLARGRFSVNRLISETEKLYSHLLERKGIIT